MTAWIERNVWTIAAALWGAAEATLFFIVPDVLLSFIGLRRGARAGAVAACAAALGAGAGGAVMYLWSAHDPDAALAAVLAAPAVSDAMAGAARAAMETQGWFLAALLGPLSTTPFKLYAVHAPHVGAPFALFSAASVIVRLPRFLIASVGAALLSRWLTPCFGARRLAVALGAAWALFYIAFFVLTPD